MKNLQPLTLQSLPRLSILQRDLRFRGRPTSPLSSNQQFPVGTHYKSKFKKHFVGPTPSPRTSVAHDPVFSVKI